MLNFTKDFGAVEWILVSLVLLKVLGGFSSLLGSFSGAAQSAQIQAQASQTVQSLQQQGFSDASIIRTTILQLKQLGFSDSQIVSYLGQYGGYSASQVSPVLAEVNAEISGQSGALAVGAGTSSLALGSVDEAGGLTN